MNPINTMFGPDERSSSEVIFRDAESLQGNTKIEHVANAMPSVFMILNQYRQVVYTNHQLMDLLPVTSDSVASDKEFLGKRTGEIFNCIHANESSTGCGTTDFCHECGGAKAILKSQKDTVKSESECRITTTAGSAYDFRVLTSPQTIKNRDYTFFCVEDIRHEKRRFALERTFFHDIINILGGVVGFSELIDTATVPEDVAESIDFIKLSSNELLAEITSHKKLLQAEDGLLSIGLSHDISSLELVEELIWISSRVWPGRISVQRDICDDFVLSTDRTLLFRVLYNMVKNAIEASSSSEVVSIWCTHDESSGVFSVHNPNPMPKSTQRQIFQRSFSTKGKGRGIGTYSMKLFGEKYLKGDVWFMTSEEEGTTFFISVPLSYEN